MWTVFQVYYVYCILGVLCVLYFRCTALELAPKKIRVNSVNPGKINQPNVTELHEISLIIRLFLVLEVYPSFVG